MKSFTFSILIVAISFTCSVDSKVVEGELITAKNWAFLSRFCFLSKDGRFKYQVQYPKDHEVQNILLYYDSNRQWPTVYKRGLDCTKQEAVLSTNNMQVINLTTRYQYSGCTERRVYSDDNETSSTVMVECDYHRYFESARERWWFIAVSNCASRKGLRLKYRFEMTNDREPWTKHFSADEFCKENRFRFVIHTPLLHCLQTGQCSRPPTRTGDGLVPVFALTIVSICLTDILHTDVIFLVLYTFLLFASFYGAYALHSRHLLHATYKIYMFSLLLELSALVCLVAHYALYAQDGVEEDTFKIAGKSLEAISTLVLLLLLILLAKGYTVTRARLKRKTTFKIIGFMALYTLVYAALFCWEKMVFDPGQVLYIYESPAGYGLIFLRLVGWAWFVYAVLFTLMHYPTKSTFFTRLFLCYSVWFISCPVVVLISALAVPKWMREKITNGVELVIAFEAHFIFYLLTRPASANKNFPFHIRTTQIGVMNKAEHGQAPGGDSLDHFNHYNYAPSRRTAFQSEQQREQNGDIPAVDSDTRF